MKKCLREGCEVLTENPKYCSLSCGAKAQPRQRKSRIRVCERVSCGIKFEYKHSKQRFCSHKCSAIVNNQKRSGVKHCLWYLCEEELNFGKKYCSREHGALHRNKEYIEDWLAGRINPQSEYSVPPRIRKFLMEESGYRCSAPTCAVPGGWSEINPTTGKIPLTIDHIDGNARNNSRDNLRVLCPSCHALTPTYGGLNKGSGRSYRYSKIK